MGTVNRRVFLRALGTGLAMGEGIHPIDSDSITTQFKNRIKIG
jgi:hypothetical protein